MVGESIGAQRARRGIYIKIGTRSGSRTLFVPMHSPPAVMFNHGRVLGADRMTNRKLRADELPLPAPITAIA